MPDGKTHDRLWKEGQPLALASALMVGAFTAHLTHDALTVVQVAGSAVMGYGIARYVTPDWDLISIDHTESKFIRSVVLLPVIAWSTLYARIMQVFGGHRSFASHFPLISSAIRLAWILFPVVVLFHFMGWLGYNYLPYAAGMLAGMTVADTIHAAADYWTVIERRYKRFVRRNRRRSRQSAD